MPIAYNGRVYEDEAAFEADTNPNVPETLKKIYLASMSSSSKTAPEGAGNRYANPQDDIIIDVEPDKKAWGVSPSPLTRDRNNTHPQNLIDRLNNPNSSNFIPVRMPLEAPTEPAGALESSGSTGVPGKALKPQ